MRFIHIADVHLGMGFESASFGARYGEQKREALWKNIKSIIRLCKTDNIDLLLIAGDFMEADSMKVSWALDLAFLFRDIPKTHIVITCGNHDPLSMLNTFYDPLRDLSNVTICEDEYETVYIESLRTSIYTHGWLDRKDYIMDWNRVIEQIDLDANHPEYRIAMFHGDMYNEGPYLYLDKEYMKNLPVDYIALGHIHKPDIVANKIAYPGSLEPLNFSEEGGHGYILGTFTGNQLQLQHQIHMERPFYTCRLDMTNMESTTEVMHALSTLIREALQGTEQEQSFVPQHQYMIRCYLEGFRSPYMSYDWSGAKQSIIKEVEQEVAYMELVDDTQVDIDMDRLMYDHGNDFIGLFIERVRQSEQTGKLKEDILRTGVSILLNHERGRQ